MEKGDSGKVGGRETENTAQRWADTNLCYVAACCAHIQKNIRPDKSPCSATPEINRYTVSECSIILLLQTYKVESETHSKKFYWNKKCNLEDIPFI